MTKLNGKPPSPSQRCVSEHTREEWLQKIRDHGFYCHYCEDDLKEATITKDHLTPLCRKGSDKIDNIVPCCRVCNQMKSWRTEEEFRADFEMLSTRLKYLGGKNKSKPCSLTEDLLDEPGLLKRLTHERERLSWCWRNPYPYAAAK